MSFPSKKISPEVELSNPAIALASVLFPHPDSPTTPSVFPLSTVRSKPFTALTVSPYFRNQPFRLGKCTCKSFTCSNGFVITRSPFLFHGVFSLSFSLKHRMIICKRHNGLLLGFPKQVLVVNISLPQMDNVDETYSL